MGRAEGRTISLGTPLEKSLTGNKGSGRSHKGRIAQRATDTRLWRRRVREDPARGRVYRERSSGIRRAWCIHVFEETSDDLTKNVASLGFKLDDLAAQKQISLDYVHIDRSEIEETGEYDLEGYLYALTMRSLRSVQSEWCWIPSKRSFPEYPILRLYGQSSSGCFNG